MTLGINADTWHYHVIWY